MRTTSTSLVALAVGHLLALACTHQSGLRGGSGGKGSPGGGVGGVVGAGGVADSGGVPDAALEADASSCQQLAQTAQTQFQAYLDSSSAEACQVDGDCTFLHLQSLNCVAACGQLVGASSASAVTASAPGVCAQYVAAGCPEIRLACPAFAAVCDAGRCVSAAPGSHGSGGEMAAGAGGSTNAGGGSGGSGGVGGAAGGAGGSCHSGSDCYSPDGGDFGPWSCISPYGAYRCGPVSAGDLPVACTEDSQCGGGQVCRVDPTVPEGWLGPSGLVCALPCATDRDCPLTDKCGGGGHCEARTCAECPSYFSCTSGACVVPSCLTDPDCPGGYCVNARCVGSLGVCQMTCF